MTLLNIKESTKDIDFLVPNQDEYKYLVKVITDLGYTPTTGHGWARDDGFVFDLFAGKRVFTTELLEPPLEKGNNIKVKEFNHIYVGVLSYYDLIISKIFRNTETDREDCLALMKAKRDEIMINELKKRFYETSSYDISNEKNRRNFEHFLDFLKKEGIKI